MYILAPVISLKLLIFRGFYSKPGIFRSVGNDNEKMLNNNLPPPLAPIFCCIFKTKNDLNYLKK